MNNQEVPQASALFVSAFVDELIACGVEDVVISPGSRSTPLAVIAYESELRVHVDIDERGAAFFALGLAKASGRPVCTICTSGTAVAHYYPAVLEAESSRVPLIVLSGDRPPQLQNLGAPQTCDQLNMFGNHVRHFHQMPLPRTDESSIAFARQMALLAFARAVGSEASVDDYGNTWYGCISDAGPVHMNFPFEEPLMPDRNLENLFTCGRKLETRVNGSPLQVAPSYPEERSIAKVKELLHENRCLVLCGEGSFANQAEARMLIDWANANNLPLLADPLSGLRSFDEPCIIDNYDTLFTNPDYCNVDLVIRFGRYPVSKACFTGLGKSRPYQIVVDAFDTRDFNAMTSLFIRSSPAAFVAAFLYDEAKQVQPHPGQLAFMQQWIEGNDAATTKISKVSEIEEGFEGAFVYRLLDLLPESSCVFSASSLSIRMLDTFYLKRGKDISVLCNRGLNGIDGTLSSALGASLCFEQSTLLIGDLAFLHDMNALALQQEFTNLYGEEAPALIVIVFNNEGGGIFDMLPQRSSDPYFERLFLTPQKYEISHIAQAFGLLHKKVCTTEEFEDAYSAFLGKPGISLIEISLSTEGFKERYGNFLS